jgi:very-short-patch-repair endonuclease
MPVKNIVVGQNVSYEMKERAKILRREMAPAERILWKELRANKLKGLHFRRQQIIIRFKNEEVFKNLSGAPKKIVETCSLVETPLPDLGSGRGMG